jgi:hypothetical protein
MSLQDKEVQGVALYLEFRKPYQTIQVILTPDGLAEDGGLVPAKFYRRMLTKDQPKKRWKAYRISIAQNFQDAILGSSAEALNEAEVADGTTQRVSQLYDFMRSLVRGEYKLVNDKPIYIELTKEDFTVIRNGDTPTKVVNRIKASRTALGFPEPVVTVPAA